MSRTTLMVSLALTVALVGSGCVAEPLAGAAVDGAMMNQASHSGQTLTSRVDDLGGQLSSLVPAPTGDCARDSAILTTMMESIPSYQALQPTDSEAIDLLAGSVRSACAGTMPDGYDTWHSK